MTDTSPLIRELRNRRELPPPTMRRALRVTGGLSQASVAAEVSRRALRSCTPEAVQNWEAGRRFPRGPLLTAYADVLRDLHTELGGTAHGISA